MLAQELHKQRKLKLEVDDIFTAVSGVHRRCRGAYATIAMITGYGILAFRDPFGIRPVVYGMRETPHGPEYMIASESVALDTLGFQLIRDLEPGEAIFISLDDRLYTRQCAENPVYSPCIFEYVYFARPDSILDDVFVHKARMRMGKKLANKILRVSPHRYHDSAIPARFY